MRIQDPEFLREQFDRAKLNLEGGDEDGRSCKVVQV